MNCPVCSVTLQMSNREGIEIDYCPKCRGIWLDRGELDKIIERSASLESSRGDRDEGHSHHNNSQSYSQGHRKKDKKSILENIFDFD